MFFESSDAGAGKQASPAPTSKVTVVGVGAVGMACAFSLTTQKMVSELCLADVDEAKLAGEVMDLQHAGNFLTGKVYASDKNYTETANSDIVIITAGARQREGETRLDLVDKNVKIMRAIVPKIAKLSPEAILLIVSNPVDVLTYVAWKLSGFPAHRVVGSGTFLDSSRFRSILASRYDVSPQSVHGQIVGEHGDSSVAVWSGSNIAGVPIALDKDEQRKIHQEVVSAAYKVIELKGCTNWAIGAAVASIVHHICHNLKRVVPLSILVSGCHGITGDVFLSLPVVLGSSGVDRIIKQPLSEDETLALQKSAETLLATIAKTGV